MGFAKLLSGRVAKVTGSNLDSDRSEYISLGNAEPDFGLPDSDNGILSSLSNGTRQFLYAGAGLSIDSSDIEVSVSTTAFNSTGFNHTSSTDLYNVIKDLDQVIGQVTGTDSSGGGAATVLTDSSIDGNGSTGSPLSLNPDVTGLTSLTVDNLKLDGNTISSTDGSNTLYIDPAPVDSNGGTLVVKGNLQVDGTTTTVNSTTVSINDKNIVLADSAANATEADGAGITVNGANATITYNSTYDAWKLNKDLRLDDNVKAIFGNGGDLQIYHNGNHSFITDAGTGDLKILGANVEIGNVGAVLNFKGVSGGASTVYYNGSAKLTTTSDGVEIPHGQLILGDDSAAVDWRIGNNSSDRLIFTIQGTGGPEMELRNDSAADYTDASLYVGGNRVLTTADPGSGNALDADTVDGLHAWQFLRSDSDDTATGRIYLSGGAGIGSSDNASYDLYNNGTTYLNGTTTIDANLIVSGTGSKVGIGTSSPSSKFEVVAASTSATALGVTIRNTESTNDYQFELGVGYPGYYDNSGIIQFNDIVSSYINSSGQWNHLTAVGIAANKQIQSLSSSNAHLNLYNDSGDTSLGTNGNLIFKTAGGSERMYIDSSGNVGIGTTSPAYDLDVDGSIGLTTHATNKYYLTNDGSFKVALQGIGSLVTVNSSGNVGIGTTSPGLPLDVNGTIRSNDALRLTNTGQFTDDTATTTTTSQTVIAQWSSTTFGGAKVIVEAKDGSNRHISELLITHDGTTAYATEYGTVHTSGSLATYDVDITSGNVRLLATPASTNSTAYKMMNTLLFS